MLEFHDGDVADLHIESQKIDSGHPGLNKSLYPEIE